jgi:hypothetical protein
MPSLKAKPPPQAEPARLRFHAGSLTGSCPPPAERAARKSVRAADCCRSCGASPESTRSAVTSPGPAPGHWLALCLFRRESEPPGQPAPAGRLHSALEVVPPQRFGRPLRRLATSLRIGLNSRAGQVVTVPWWSPGLTSAFGEQTRARRRRRARPLSGASCPVPCRGESAA